MDFPRFLRLSRFLAATAGRKAIHAGLVLYLAVGMFAFVLFAGNGLDAKSVIRLALTSWISRLALLGAWITATLPVARSLLGSKEMTFVRALPIPSLWLIGLFALSLSLAHAPWFGLWLRGGGIGLATSALGTSLALQAVWVGGIASAIDALFALGVAGVWLVHPSPVVAPIAAATALRAVARAWSRIAEPSGVGRHWVASSNRPLAVGSALGIALCRGHAPVIARAAALVLGSCLITIVALTNNGVTDRTAIGTIAQLVWVPACIFGSISLASPLLRIESTLRWLFELTATSVRVRSAACAAVLVLPSILAGVSFGAAVGSDLHLSLLETTLLALELAGTGAAWAAIALFIARRSLRATGRDSGRLIVALSVAYVTSLGLLWVPRAPGVLLLLIVATAITLIPSDAKSHSFAPGAPNA